jgi:transcriptional regulator with XRE-family HTH domain
VSVAGQFGDNLRRHRKAAGLSQEEAAVRASLHRTAVGHLERGERVARADTIAKLAGVLGVDPGDLFDGIAWEPGGIRVGRFIAQEVPGLGTVQRSVEVERPARRGG